MIGSGLSKKEQIKLLLSIGAGSGLGGISRYAAEIIFSPFFTDTFPFEILIVNLAGSLIIGIAAAATQLNQIQRHLLIAGFCGGFTTFSTFSLQTVEWFSAGHFAAAFGNIFATVGGGIAAAWLGLKTGSIGQSR